MENILKYFSDFTPQQLEQFSKLKDLYTEWNEKINVVSRKDIESLYERHVLHSLSIAASFEFQPGMEIVDLGTGGGFPGVPLAIFFPEVKFHLVDSINKKLKVVEAVAEGAGIKNITTQHSRIEDVKNRKFDYVVSRAVAPLKDLWRWSKPLLKSQSSNPAGMPGPGLVCLKGGDLHLEIQESLTRPRMMSVKDIFEEEFFQDKFIIYVPRA
ncbi:16S rRNA (guanine(527)-N(7))-methyltransferase RsmG [Terrimonas sp. NA20]|uniref:Ribosomal RNA small subunit methyltransferase G n=1 Tax=Terrimonas ginsenosidimutans TaxID=2908004 RepID=A0ABS9KPU4_9BACT|nr:16S rRNA (guanine(527)-N(7))-methyltransferase RsmG [Terrimonas ginsenosidimutans]MCG2614345.1 16S rRNA (guanine(527)-N(7))-methyltransferase RsmG [Terrimonas ginsenosidimutans]